MDADNIPVLCLWILNFQRDPEIWKNVIEYRVCKGLNIKLLLCRYKPLIHWRGSMPNVLVRSRHFYCCDFSPALRAREVLQIGAKT